MEQTSKRVAKIAGKVLAKLDGIAGPMIMADEYGRRDPRFGTIKDICTVAELRSLAASVLTQAPDRKKAK